MQESHGVNLPLSPASKKGRVGVEFPKFKYPKFE
jgi:hypothetical protein